jgi:hypothetical protein
VGGGGTPGNAPRQEAAPAPSTGTGGSPGDGASLEEGTAVVSFAVPSCRFSGYALVFEQIFMNIPAFHPLLPPIVELSASR